MIIIDKETEIKVHGYDPLGDILVPDKSIMDFTAFIDRLEISKRKYCLGPATKKEVIENAQSFFKKNFKLHKIPYKGSFRCKLDKCVLSHTPGLEFPLTFHNLVRNIDPFDLPISFSSTSIFECMLIENITFINVDEFLNRMKVSFREIILPSQISELTESSYVHEITHTQLVHQRGIIKNYYNSEIPSIFMELLNIHESLNSDTLLPFQDQVRLIELYEILYKLESQAKGLFEDSKDDLIEATKYANSIIKSYGLFAEYFYGTPSLKKYILKSIQKVLDGSIQLEDLLDEFEITVHTSIDNPKLIKYFSR